MEQKPVNMMDRLLSLDLQKPETSHLKLSRLGIVLTLRQISYDKQQSIRNEKEDNTLHYILASVKDPDFRNREWYEEKMGCVTPIHALKKLLNNGEISAISNACDRLNGYQKGQVLLLSDKELEAEIRGQSVEELAKN